jgi:hypothetical protein
MKFKNGFRILNNKDTEDKFFVIDDVKIKIGDEFRVGPNGYFEHIGNVNDALLSNEEIDDRSYASILMCKD